jgi:hypothetical protein
VSDPIDLNDVFRRPAASPPPAPRVPPPVAQRANAVSTPRPWQPPVTDAFTQSMYEAQRRNAARNNLLYGTLLLVGGILVTAITYDTASRQGGGYILAVGPIVFGVIRIFKGLAG